MHLNTEAAPRGAEQNSFDAIVIGAGLGGLAAAALVARAGRSVVVLEQAGDLGGRAATTTLDGVHFNLGPRAIYARGHARRLLAELGVPFAGHFPNPGRPLVTLGDSSYRIPTGLSSLAVSRLLNASEKLRLGRLFATIRGLDTRQFDRTPLSDWIVRTAGKGKLAALLAALFRVGAYIDDAQRLSAGVAIDQLRDALIGNVLYVDGGWQTLVDGLRKLAIGHAAAMRTGARAKSVDIDADGATVRLASGETLRGRTIILAVAPETACELLHSAADEQLAHVTAGRIPVAAACLDVALARLPRPGDRFALGLDRPLYFSVHSAAAKLGPDGVAVLHAMKYLRGDAEEQSPKVEGELETFLDSVQPGWQAQVVARRFLPRMTVTHVLPRTAEGGLSARPAVAANGRPRVFLVGDWVGPIGMLADAVAVSAEEAARRALADIGSRNVP